MEERKRDEEKAKEVVQSKHSERDERKRWTRAMG